MYVITANQNRVINYKLGIHTNKINLSKGNINLLRLYH